MPLIDPELIVSENEKVLFAGHVGDAVGQIQRAVATHLQGLTPTYRTQVVNIPASFIATVTGVVERTSYG